MEKNSEIKALLALLDDPDEEVFRLVCDRIYTYGEDIIPILDSHWQELDNELVFERLERLIFRVHYRSIKEQMRNWAAAPDGLLLPCFLIASLTNPNLSYKDLESSIEKIRRNLWVDLNNYLTPLEELNVINSILYNYYQYNGRQIDTNHSADYLLSQLIRYKTANTLAVAMLYLVLMERLDIPVKMIRVPNLIILAYMGFEQTANDFDKIKYCINPTKGQVFSRQDIIAFLRKSRFQLNPDAFKPMSHKELIGFYLKEYAMCFRESDPEKAGCLDELFDLLFYSGDGQPSP